MSYLRNRATAERMIRQKGKRIELVERVRTGGTERSPIYTMQYHPAYAVELNQRLKNLDGSLAPGVVHQLLVSTEGLPFRINNGMLVRMSPDEQEINISEARPLEPGDVTILWEVDLAG